MAQPEAAPASRRVVLAGTVSNGIIQCPCHGSQFSIKDGSVVNGPATQPLAPVAIKLEGTSIVEG